MTQEPFLYDDGPAPLHTGTPKSRQGWIIGVIVGIALLSPAMIGILYLVKGSPAEQATESAGVLVASLTAGDTETAHQLLCGAEQGRLEADEVAGAYLGALPGEVGGVRDDDVEGAAVQLVTVSWADGSTTEIRVVNEDGPRVCGVVAGD